MRTNPEPGKSLRSLFGQRSIMQAHTHCPEIRTSKFLEAQGGMARLQLEQSEILIGESLDLRW
jgi:hypothetical protein